MHLAIELKALILGIVEGLTEFLPVSSTGHLIVAGSLLDFNDEKGKAFEVIIQFGAILAVCWEFRHRIAAVCAGLLRRRPDARALRFAINVVIATIPAVALALLFEKSVKAVLFAPVPVAAALVVGGLVILWAEHREGRRGTVSDPRGNALLASAKVAAPRIESVDDLNWKDALKVGCAQCFALIPGTSRSGSTIIGGLLCGLSRQVATEFSFFLAIPVIFGATLHDLYKSRGFLHTDDLGLFGIGFVAAFVSGFVCVRWLLRFVATHDFRGFAWYRIGFGALILVTAMTGWIRWS